MTGIFSVGEQQAFISFDPRTKLYMLFVFNLINLSSTESVLINNLKLVLAFLTFIMLLNVRKPRAAVTTVYFWNESIGNFSEAVYSGYAANAAGGYGCMVCAAYNKSQ